MNPANAESSTVRPSNSRVPLESILCTEELNRRPSRPPDYETENRSLLALAQALADSPRTILQALADTILEGLQADSAGISLLTKDETRFHWPAIAGRWQSHIGSGTPRDFSPCGDVLDRNAPLLFRRLERHYTYFLPVTPPVEEALLVPFFVKGKAVGTLWAIAHTERRKFDAEDLRQLGGLGRFASSAYQVGVFMHDALELRRATLNLLEDAVQLRQVVETSNAQLHVSEERFRTLFTSAPMAIFVCDQNAVIQQYNQRAVELWGREPLCGVEQHCGSMKLWRPNGTLLPHAQSPIVEVLRTGVPARNVEVFIERPDGVRLPVLVNFSALMNAKGDITGAISSFVDITERKQAEEALHESEERFRTLAEHMSQFAWMADATGWISWYNQRWYEYTGTTFEEMQGWGWEKVHHPDHVDRVVGKWRRAHATGEPWEDTFPLRGVDGQYRWFLSRALPIRDADGRINRWFGTNTDITELRDTQALLSESEERLRTFSGQLEQLVQDRTEELVQMQDRLRLLTMDLSLTEQRERKHLASELHDHLAQLLALGQMKLGQSRLLTQSAGRRDALIEQTEAVLSDAIIYMRTLVANLSPQILYEFGLPAALRWLGEQMQRYDLAVTVQIETAELQLSEDQAVLLFQCVRELLMNAVKHAKADHATIRIAQTSTNLRIEVRDQGAGFEPPAAVIANPDAVEASKFGLFSIRERMKALGGRFELYSAPDQGTTATLTLPLESIADSGLRAESTGTAISHQRSVVTIGSEDAAPEVISHQPRPSAPTPKTHSPTRNTPSRPIRVLLVDDHAIVRQGLRGVLESYPDVEVVGEAMDGEEAVAAAEALQPSHVVMDINMPKLSGIQATALIKSRCPDVFVIALSVHASGPMEDAIIQAGATILLTKGAVVSELYSAILTTLSGAARSEQ